MSEKPAKAEKTVRHTVDLSAYPDLVVMYLGMRARSLRGVLSIAKLGPQIQKSVEEKPDGLLKHDQLTYSVVPFHVGMRQYWRDVESLLAWSAKLPHLQWWKDFMKDSGGTTFWHETYFAKGGFECVFDDLPDDKRDFGFPSFAPVVPAVGSMFAKFRKAKKTAPS
jgi:hypothetical protein